MEKINIGELLKDCPEGTKLYSPLCGECELHMIDNDIITCSFSENLYHICFDIYGHYRIAAYKNSECLLFPSKENRDWTKFQRPFKDGDVLYIDCNDGEDTYEQHQYIFILKQISEGKIDSYCYVNGTNQSKFEICWLANMEYNPRFATEEEKETLFKAIKDNGYRWNAEIKTLEKLIIPKFKVGDKIANRNSISTSWIVSSVSSEYYGLKLPNAIESIGMLPVSEQDSWVLAPIIPKFTVGDIISNGRICSKIRSIDANSYQLENDVIVFFKEQNNFELVPDKFDISTLKPFESRVLVRTDNRKWVAAFYSHYDKDCLLLYCVVGGLWYEQCIPFEGNEHLLNTTDECDDYYKNW